MGELVGFFVVGIEPDEGVLLLDGEVKHFSEHGGSIDYFFNYAHGWMMKDEFDEQPFYELCQAYRHSDKMGANLAETVAAFEAIKAFARKARSDAIEKVYDSQDAPEDA